MIPVLATDWPVFFAAAGGFVSVLGVTVTGVIIAWRTGQKVDAAALRRERIAQAIIDPNVTSLPPKEPPAA